jgi:hypothetical protein
VTLGSDWITSALDERRGLARVAVLRIGGPLTTAVPPLWTWPADLRAAVCAGSAIVAGGAEYDGRRPAPLDAEAVRRFLAEVAPVAEAVAIVGVFSPLAPEDELAAADLVRAELGRSVSVSLSHEIGSLGLLERESATALNATLAAPARGLAELLAAELAARGIATEPYVSQNDGSAMALDHALRFPLLMVGAGPVPALRGAAFLSGIGEGVVVADDGACTDVGVLLGGQLRDGPDVTEVAGVRTPLRRPEIVRLAGAAGPGDEDRADVVWRGLVASGVLRDDAAAGGGDGAPTSVVAVGSGAEVVARALAGRPGIVAVVPPEAHVAGAIGAAVALAHGTADLVSDHDDEALRATVVRARRTAIERAVHAGADPAVVGVVDVEQLPLSYLVGPAVRVRARAAGPCA